MVLRIRVDQMRITFLLLTSCYLAGTANANPGWTLEECIDNYGTAHLSTW